MNTRGSISGATMIEFAVVVPVFFVLVLGFFDIARYWQARSALAEAAADAVNRAAVDLNLKKKWSTASEDQAGYQQAMTDLEQFTKERAAALMLHSGSPQIGAAITYPSSATDSQTVPVNVEVWADFSPILPGFLPPNKTLHATVAGYIEQFRTAALPIPVDCFNRLYDSFSPPGSGDYNKGCPCAKGPFAYSGGSTSCFCDGEAGVTNGTTTQANGQCGCPSGQKAILGFDWNVMAGFGWSSEAIAGANAASTICCPTNVPDVCPNNQVRPSNASSGSFTCNCSCGPNAAPDAAGNCKCNNSHQAYSIQLGQPKCTCTLTAADCPSPATLDAASCGCACPTGKTFDEASKTCGCTSSATNSCQTGGNVAGTMSSICGCTCPANSAAQNGGCQCSAGRVSQSGSCVCNPTVQTACSGGNVAGTWSSTSCACSCPSTSQLNASGNCICKSTLQTNCGGTSTTEVAGNWTTSGCSCACPADSLLDSQGRCMCGTNRIRADSACVCDGSKQSACTSSGPSNLSGTWNASACSCSCPSGTSLNSSGQCVCPAPKTNVGGVCACSATAQTACGTGNMAGTWSSASCSCSCPANSSKDGSGQCMCTSGLSGSCTNATSTSLSGSWSDAGCQCTCPAGSTLSAGRCSCGTNRINSNGACICDSSKQSACTSSGTSNLSGTWNAAACSCSCPSGTSPNASGQCVCPAPKTNVGGSCSCDASKQAACSSGEVSGTWSVNACTCSCPSYSVLSNNSCGCSSTFTASGGQCVCPAGKSVVNGTCQCSSSAQTTCQNSGGTFSTSSCGCSCSGDKSLSQDGTQCQCPAATHGFTLVAGNTTCSYVCQNKNGAEYTVINGYCVQADICSSRCQQFYDDGTCSGCPNG